MAKSFAAQMKSVKNPKPGEQYDRRFAGDWAALAGYLPNPDNILLKIGREHDVFTELMPDAHMSAVRSSRFAGVSSLLWEIDRGKAKSERAKAIEDNLKALDIYRVIREVVNCVDFGFNPMEIMWEYNKGQGIYLAGDIIAKPTQWFLFGEQNELRFRGLNAAPTGEPVPDMKFLLPRNNPTYNNPYGEAQMSKCYWPITFKRANIKFWITFAEKYGMPWAIGKLPVSQSRDQTIADALLTQLENAIQDNAMVIPDDSSVELKESSRTSSSELYRDLIAWANSEMSKAYLGHDSAASSTPGKLGNEGGMLEVRGDIIRGDKRLVENTMNQFIKWFCAINYGAGEVPVFTLFEEEDVDKNVADRDRVIFDLGWRPTEEYIKKTYNMADGDFTLVEPPTTPAFAFAAPAAPAVPPDQKAIDAEVDGLTAGKLQTQMEPIIQPLMALIAGEKSYAGVMGKLIELYPKMDSEAVEKALQKAIFVSNAVGRTSNAKA